MSGMRIRELSIKIRGGFLEPFYTGKMFAYYCAARGAFPSLMSHVSFQPDFSAEKLEAEGKGLVSLRMYYILRFVFGILVDITKDKVRKLMSVPKIRQRGASYG